ncbi:response regulator [bacterium]|nr:response regulator [bacterium]
MTKCLVVDDDTDMLQVLSGLVQVLGFQVITARDGDEAWELYKRELPNIVISDIHMPNRNGLLLMSDIRQHNSKIPVILITGYFQYRGILETHLPDAYLEKPFTISDLRQAIDQVLPLETVVH